MKASVKKTVRGTVFSERAEESFSMALNHASEMEEKNRWNALVLRQPQEARKWLI